MKRKSSDSKFITSKNNTSDDNQTAKKPRTVQKLNLEKPTESKKSENPVVKSKSSEKMKRPCFIPKIFSSKRGRGAAADGGAGENGDRPNWVQMKKEKKELKEKRKAKKLSGIYKPTVQAKLIGEKLRRGKYDDEDRQLLSSELYRLLTGTFNKMVFSHDMSRVVQWLLKYCEPEVSELVMTELKPSYLEMFKSKYAKNCIKKALKHGTENIRKEILEACYGHVVKLVSHSMASPIIDYAYANYASDMDKLHFKQEFYGDMYKHAKDDNIKQISDVYALATDMKPATLSAVKINLSRILNKKLVGSPIAQEVLVDYLTVCSFENRAEMIVMLRSSIVELSKSENGTKLAMTCIWYGTNKDRKLSLKSMKGHVKDICKSEHGYAILLAIFDSVDDTVLVKKLILSEILADLVDIAMDDHGRKVILYLVARRDTAYFHPTQIAYFEQGDANAHTKKAADVRENELMEIVIEPLLDSIGYNVVPWLSSSSAAMVTLAVLKRGNNEEKLFEAFTAVACFILDDHAKVEEDNGIERVAVEHSGLHMMLKRLILIESSFEERNLTPFGQVLKERLNENVIARWIHYNRACFLLIWIIENSSNTSALKEMLRPMSKILMKKRSSGAKILLKKIQ